ncbi:TniQ family protein [Burkholderia thailandensis]|uniref:TniQ family protein n=1 Tax=Burkholderia thailandensis TaxID=57975 RepID=A0AAW9CKL5_BURTH|nr:TniQ family protein [Burkholderia thailandensis]MCS3395322.1 TniQ family protein [Burkholderia thailandensis]MCS6428923.1 TniQ family protein [Burkholderia thailandensis]MCS6456717.1 TniQ family protein [Burkholderia thailandensis]MCS6468008.1 TniQ family protein [Burkholderia thailandensis]MCS6486442.1 TniQ family protein [Burkholderia thailandensis]
MSYSISNPRSTLHALVPIGLDTPEVESLLSYFCRLAVSHSVSVAALCRQVAGTVGWELSEKHEWHVGNIGGIGDAASNWAAGLSALTSVERLDRLTLLPWRNVIAQTSLAATRSRWCPACFAEDKESGKTPYFRLAWDVGAVTVCAKHKAELVHICPDCGRPDARHKSAYVVPGWCAHCGAFLGDGEPPPAATPEELWKATQVGAMLKAQGSLETPPTRQAMLDAIQTLVTRLDNGKGALFARRVGLSKTTVHYWLKQAGAPALPAHLRIASQTGLALPQLLTGDLIDWAPCSAEVHQLALLFPDETKRAAARAIDWDSVRAERNDLGADAPRGISLICADESRDSSFASRMLHRNNMTLGAPFAGTIPQIEGNIFVHRRAFRVRAWLAAPAACLHPDLVRVMWIRAVLKKKADRLLAIFGGIFFIF